MQHFFTKYYFILSILFFGSSSLAISQEKEKFTISGYVKDVSNGESSYGASVYIKELMKGGSTNEYGFYSITVEKGAYHLVVSYMGYTTVEKEIKLDKDLQLNIDISPAVATTKTVVVSSEKSNKNVTGTSVGAIKLDMEEIKKLPAFMGEVDVLKTIQLLPGVKSAGDGNSGFYVRGGGPDQNLILLDEAVIYNAAHLMGFFSVFNGDAIKNINLIKGGMPAQYGGRLSSVLDISMKEGNNKTFHADGGLGLISSRLTLQGPLKKEKGSFIVSGRRSYGDVMAKLFANPQAAVKNAGLYFYDLNAKLNYRLSGKDRVFLSGYLGRDVFNFADPLSGFNFGVSWGNATGVLRWNHLFSDKLFMNVSGIFTNYDNSFGVDQNGFQFKMFSGIRDWNGKVDFSYFPNTRHEIKYGTNYVFHTFTPSSLSAKLGETVLDFGPIKKDKAHEAAVYVSDDFEWTSKLKIHAGLRYSYFMQIGPFDRYLKDPVTGQTSQIVHYNSNEKVKQYGGFEPRLNIRYQLKANASVKASFTRNLQYIHLASLSTVGFPSDTWVPSSQLVKPQIGTQYSVGYFQNFLNNFYEASVEVYYKDLKNQIEYKDGSLPGADLNDNTDNSFTFGKGWAYGAEFFVKKRMGKFNGWLGYTLSYTKRKFAAINLGNEYYAKYDRRHDLSLVLCYDLSDMWTFSLIQVYGTGTALTIPVAYYFVDANFITEYSPRNAYRMPAYHRMDISATYTPDRVKKLARKKQRLIKDYERRGKDPATIELPKKWAKNYSTNWNFSVFNVYNRHNPYIIYLASSGNVLTGNLKVGAKKLSLFGIIPSITWNFKF
jgi:TonB dependent receptor/CarboxypepD_reg-like domain/TonB-dependent Receptor Plug Domain